MKLSKKGGDRKIMYKPQDPLEPKKGNPRRWLGSKHGIALQPRTASETNVLHDTESLERKADHTTMKRIPVETASLRLPRRDEIRSPKWLLDILDTVRDDFS